MTKKPTLNKLNKRPALWYCKKEDLWWISYPEPIYLDEKWPYESEAFVDGDIEFRPSSYMKFELLKMRDVNFICWI